MKRRSIAWGNPPIVGRDFPVDYETGDGRKATWKFHACRIERSSWVVEVWTANNQTYLGEGKEVVRFDDACDSALEWAVKNCKF